MKIKLLCILSIFLISKNNAQEQISNFTYEDTYLSSPSSFFTFNDLMYFYASNDGYGREIWTSDGTNTNTKILKDIHTGSANSAVSFLNEKSALLHNELFFIAENENSEGELWKTDGTSEGTIQITNFINDRASELTAVGNHIFFLIKADDTTLQVWKTDGTTDGTVLVKDNLDIWNTPSFQGKCNETFIFTFQPNGSNESRVWRSDGTSEGTFAITENIDGNGSGPGGTSALSQYIEYNDKLYFVSRYYLHETDGTLEHTTTLANIWDGGSNLANYSDVIEANNKLYFQFYSSNKYQLAIYESDGTTANTKQIYFKQGTDSFFPSALHTTTEALLFSSPNDNGATTLTALNLNDYSTSLLIDLVDSYPTLLYVSKYKDIGHIYNINDEEYFITAPVNSTYSKKGWISNFKTNTTVQVSDLDDVSNAIVYNQELYYAKDYQLWKYSNVLHTDSFTNSTSLSLYPNPSYDFITFKTDQHISSVKIYDTSGRLMINIPDVESNTINISKLSLGHYIAQIRVNNTLISKQLIKK
ncbi:T9SS type A sorting domain-containing protein [Formosa algae]|uniref:T9SS type A sorting domain-containing protein n=1 Tax=Formosa algae TaxID=225843 RepID=UPI000CCF764B|nr:T9SS type A sorting domain-containing protein [Formosa algae]PNW28740.1 hypothetical protein BKP44_07445 [Formosa algae]